MAVDAFIHFDRLRCLTETDANGHSEPYAWTVLIWVDDTTFSSGQIVGSIGPGNVQGSRAVIRDGIKDGEEASMPSVQRSFTRRFEDDDFLRNIGIVVVLFDQDDMPTSAVRAAYSAFKRELPKALADFIRTNLRGPETDDERKEIANKVRPKVRAAGRDALTNFEKIQVALGNLKLDDEFGFDSVSIDLNSNEPLPSTFTLSFEQTDPVLGLVNHYEIDGRFELRELPAPDPCQAELDRVNQARATVNGFQTSINQLQEDLQKASPSEKPAIIREIRRIREEELPAATTALEVAQRALASCRD